MFAPVAVTNNARRAAINKEMAICFGKAHGEPVVELRVQLQPASAQAFSSPADVEQLCHHHPESLLCYYVRGAAVRLTDNICPEKGLANGTGDAVLHSITFAPDSNPDSQLHRLEVARPGEIIQLQVPPASVNVRMLGIERKMERLRQSLLEKANAKRRARHAHPVEEWEEEEEEEEESDLELDQIPYPWPEDQTLVPGQVVIPVQYCRIAECLAISPKASIQYKQWAFDLVFAITYHKLQGATVSKIKLDVNPGGRPPLSAAMMNVALSRVRHGSDIRLLPIRSCNLDHLTKLKFDPALGQWMQKYILRGPEEHYAAPREPIVQQDFLSWALIPLFRQAFQLDAHADATWRPVQAALGRVWCGAVIERIVELHTVLETRELVRELLSRGGQVSLGVLRLLLGDLEAYDMSITDLHAQPSILEMRIRRAFHDQLVQLPFMMGDIIAHCVEQRPGQPQPPVQQPGHQWPELPDQ